MTLAARLVKQRATNGGAGWEARCPVKDCGARLTVVVFLTTHDALFVNGDQRRRASADRPRWLMTREPGWRLINGTWQPGGSVIQKRIRGHRRGKSDFGHAQGVVLSGGAFVPLPARVKCPRCKRDVMVTSAVLSPGIISDASRTLTP